MHLLQRNADYLILLLLLLLRSTSGSPSDSLPPHSLPWINAALSLQMPATALTLSPDDSRPREPFAVGLLLLLLLPLLRLSR